MRHVMTCALLLSFGLTQAQEVKVIKYPTLASEMDQFDGLTVVNFWATWCGPCIKELPYFEEANELDNVRVLLVSLDFPDEQEKVKRFVSKKGLDSEIMLLDEKDYDAYMSKVDPSWSGAIPATLMVESNGRKHFYEKAFEREQLFAQINKFIN
ncbi:MAG: TlpA disulfide reductase family protein [Bacteroidota bacterium]